MWKLKPFVLCLMVGVLSGGMPCRLAEASCDSGLEQDLVLEGFQNPPMSVRPFVRWWWNGDKVTKEEIVRELDVMKQAGIGGVEINPIAFPSASAPTDIPSLTWLSDEWLEMLEVAVQAAQERGITADCIVGSGWPFGGRFLRRGEQTQIMTLGAKALKGPAQITLTEQELLDETELEIGYKHDTVYKEIKQVRLVPARLETFDPGIDLTDQIKDGTLAFSVPEGDYILRILVLQEGFQAVILGASGSDGPVLNHYNKEAVRKYLDRMSDAIKGKLGPLEGKIRAMFCDSLELEGANWSVDMAEEFQKRRGYSLWPYLPFILTKIGHQGEIADDQITIEFSPAVQDLIERVRYDFCRTRVELFGQRFVKTFAQWCRDNGVKSRAQAYGRGFHPIESSMEVDIPECETWIGGWFSSPGGMAPTVINKFVASGAHFAGNRLVSCEEITNTSEVFNATLQTIKIAGDQSNLSGVTHSILHGFNYSPREVPFPGWVRYGTFFNERNPWWPYVRKWMDYKARLSWVLQHAEPQAEIAILHPLADIWSRYNLQRHPFPKTKYPEYQFTLWEGIHRSGSTCDYISEGLLNEGSCQAGQLETHHRTYSTLILMKVTSIQPETAQKLLQFAQAGGTIVFIGEAPSRSPGLIDAKSNDAAVRRTMARILKDHSDRCRVVDPPSGPLAEWFAGVQKQFNLKPKVRFANPHPRLSQIYLTAGPRDIFFIANGSHTEPVETFATFDIADKTPWIWDLETGQRALFPCGNDKQNLSLRLGPAESLLLVFEPGEEENPPPPSTPPTKEKQVVQGIWDLQLLHANGQKTELTLAELVDFKDDPRLSSFAGQAIYTIEFQLDKKNSYNVLDLGIVHGVSLVKLNGQDLGLRWYGRHVYDLKGALQGQNNTLEIRVITTLGNYCKSLPENSPAFRWTKHQPLRSVGLIGPVRLLDHP